MVRASFAAAPRIAGFFYVRSVLVCSEAYACNAVLRYDSCLRSVVYFRTPSNVSRTPNSEICKCENPRRRIKGNAVVQLTIM